MSNRQSFTLPARAETIKLVHCVPVLTGSMYRLVIDQKLDALREFHRMGIPLDAALDFAVQKGFMPLIQELLQMGVQPSPQTLLRAVRRGIKIRNLFLDCVEVSVDHLDAAVASENFDTALSLLDRGVIPTLRTVGCISGKGKPTEDRKAVVGRLVETVDVEVIGREETLAKMACWTSVAQFERALDRHGSLPQASLESLLQMCIRTASPGHVRVMLNRGAQLTADRLKCALDLDGVPSQFNPKGNWIAVARTGLEAAVAVGCLFPSSQVNRPLVSRLVRLCAFCSTVPETEFLHVCGLIAHLSAPECRVAVARCIVDELNWKAARLSTARRFEGVGQLEERVRAAVMTIAPADSDPYSPRISP